MTSNLFIFISFKKRVSGSGRHWEHSAYSTLVHSTVSNVSTWARDSALVAPYNIPLARNVTTFNPHN